MNAARVEQVHTKIERRGDDESGETLEKRDGSEAMEQEPDKRVRPAVCYGTCTVSLCAQGP